MVVSFTKSYCNGKRGNVEAFENELVGVDIITAYLTEAQIKKTNDQGINDFYAKSTMEGKVAALKDAFKKYSKDKKVPSDVKIFLDRYIEGYKRMIKHLELNGDRNPSEGKAPFTFAAYRSMSEFAIQKDKIIRSVAKANLQGHVSGDAKDGLLFNILAVVLCWNLVARSISVIQLMFTFFRWENDHIVITDPKHKGDQTGEKTVPKPLFANLSADPLICPFLWLGVSLLSRSDTQSASVFGDKEAEGRDTSIGRFSRWCKLCATRFVDTGYHRYDYRWDG